MENIALRINEVIPYEYIKDNWLIMLQSVLRTLSLVIVCYSIYYSVKSLWKVSRFFTTVYEYRPALEHLKGRAKNKLYGRVNRKTGKKEEPPPMVPNGWYYVMASYDLKNEEVKHVTMCGLELAVFRDSYGEVHAVDAFCPHLGANMAIGGRVKGKCIECPFHAWQFSGEDGKCTDIPGARKIPDIAKVKSWPILERNLLIMLWFDAEEREPLWLPKELDEIYQDGWTIQARGEHIMHAHISEIPENGADIAHFNPVHQPNFWYGSSLEDINKIKERSNFADHKWSEAGWKASTEDWYLANGNLRHDLLIFGKTVPKTYVQTHFEQMGPGMVHLVSDVPYLGKIVLIMLVTPIETFKQRVVHVALGPSSMLGKCTAVAGLRMEGCMVERDAVLWNNKVFSQHSILASSDADELIVKFRRWFSQFYSENSRIINTREDLSW